MNGFPIQVCRQGTRGCIPDYFTTAVTRKNDYSNGEPWTTLILATAAKTMITAGTTNVQVDVWFTTTNSEQGRAWRNSSGPHFSVVLANSVCKSAAYANVECKMCSRCHMDNNCYDEPGVDTQQYSHSSGELKIRKCCLTA